MKESISATSNYAKSTQPSPHLKKNQIKNLNLPVSHISCHQILTRFAMLVNQKNPTLSTAILLKNLKKMQHVILQGF
jgi:hypothetical protein